jgi:hypothetical protein
MASENLQAADLPLLHQPPELRHRHPVLLLVRAASSTASTASSSAAPITASTLTATATAALTETALEA